MPSEPVQTLAPMTHRECEDLLHANHWGRLGVLVDDRPEIFPLNYAMDGHRIVFRIDRGAKLASVRRSRTASFQIDHVDEAGGTGWSVMAVGPVAEVVDDDDVARLEGLGLETWVVGDEVHWMRLSPHRLSGRRVTRP